MRHIPLCGGGWSGSAQSKPLAQLRKFFAPNVVILSRAVRPPIPGLESDEGAEKSPVESEDSNRATKSILRGMSEKSSLNLARLLSTLDWKRNGSCVHVTLTYGKEFPAISDGLASVKAQLVARFGGHCVCGIWRLEFQKRLAPHFHLLCWVRPEFLPQFECWVSGWWCKFSGNFSDYGCKITRGDAGRAAWYLCTLADGKITDQPEEIHASIRCEPDTPRLCAIPQPTLHEIRLKIEKHITQTYLKQVQAPVGVKPVLKCWMELN